MKNIIKILKIKCLKYKLQLKMNFKKETKLMYKQFFKVEIFVYKLLVYNHVTL